MQTDGTPNRRPRPRRDWGAFAFALVLVAVMSIYAFSVIDVARRTTDWLLIVPAAGVGVLAALWAGIGDLRRSPRLAQMAEASRSETVRPLILIALTLLYACTLPWVGFDLGTAIYILLCLLVQGERALWKLALASVGGAALISWIFVDLLMVRLPVLFL